MPLSFFIMGWLIYLGIIVQPVLFVSSIVIRRDFFGSSEPFELGNGNINSGLLFDGLSNNLNPVILAGLTPDNDLTKPSSDCLSGNLEQLQSRHVPPSDFCRASGTTAGPRNEIKSIPFRIPYMQPHVPPPTTDDMPDCPYSRFQHRQTPVCDSGYKKHILELPSLSLKVEVEYELMYITLPISGTVGLWVGIGLD